MNRVTTYVCACLALLLALPVQAQEQVSIREINEIPQDNIAALQALGDAVTEDDMVELIRSPFDGQSVTFTGVLIGEPQYSGLASVDDDTGLPGRVHFFVRDTAAATLGPLGMDIQIVDGYPGYQEHGVLGLFKGDVVTITGDVTYFGYGLQITPETVEFQGDYQSLGLPASILDPVTITTADLHQNVGGTSQRIDWQNLVDYNQTLVRIEDATVWRSPNREDARPNWAVTSDGAVTILQNDDMSLCYRNDKNDYPDTFNTSCIENDFVAPPPGAVVDVEGFALLRTDWDPFGIGAPSQAMFKIVTWEEDDLVITQEPSITAVMFEGLDGVVGNAPIDITVTVEGDASGVVDAQLVYQTSAMADADSIALTDNGDGTFTGQIPAQEDETFLWYSAFVTHENGTDFATPAAATTRVLYDGINEIADVQEPWAELGDESPFVGSTVPMDLTVTVQSDPSTSGMIVVQDDPGFGPYSGIILGATEELTANLQTGDVITISQADVVENFDVTELRNITYEEQSTGDALGYKVVDSAMLQDDAIAEAHEGMMVRFENHIILQADAGFGEWSFSSDGTEDNEVFADDQSAALGSSFNDRFSQWERIDYMQGIWWYSFGAYKLIPESEGDVGSVTNVSAEDDQLPGTFALSQNFPNPFNPVTSITFTVPQAGQVTLEVFDMLGRSVEVLVSEERPAGTYEVKLDGTALSSGVYIYRLSAGDQTAVRKMILMK